MSEIISQSNVLTESRIEYSALERNIFYMILSKLKKEPQKHYYVSVKEMAEKTGVASKYEQYRKATERLTSVVYSFNRPENGNLLQVSLFASCEYLSGQGLIEVEISEKLKPYLFDLKNNFTMYQLEIALTLKSRFSKRLYEILSQWRDKEEKTFDLLDLKRMLDLYDPKTGKESMVNWSDFQNKVLKKAQHDFKTTKSEITFDYKANKFGRKFNSITFKIQSKPYQTKIDFTDENAELFEKLVNTCKLRKDQATRVLANFTENEIKTKLRDMQIKKKDGKIDDIGGYSATIFNVK